jgi:hypothetical protein
VCISIVVLSTNGLKIWVTVIIITITFITIDIVAFLVVHPSSLHVKRAVAVAVVKFICGLWCHRSAFSLKNSIFIDKGEFTNCKIVSTHCFSPLFASPGLQYHGSGIHPKNVNLIKKGEWMNCKIVKARCFLSIFFASLLCFNKHKRAEVATGQTSVCGLRYHWSHVWPKMAI